MPMVSPTTPMPSPHSPPLHPHKKAGCSPPANPRLRPDISATTIPQKTRLSCSMCTIYFFSIPPAPDPSFLLHHHLDHPFRRVQPSRKLRLHFIEPHPMRDIHRRIDQPFPHRLHHAI